MLASESSKLEPSVLPYLPEDIITTYILTRLPVKTLFKFRCVSKSWLNLISDTNFINTHLVNSSKSNSFNQQKAILLRKNIVPDPRRTDSYYLKSHSFHSIFSPSLPGNGDFSKGHPIELGDRLTKIVGSCNGLVCIAIEVEAYFIWNPSTRESKTFSVFNKSLGPYVIYCLGFGYDRLTHDYKVVHMEFKYAHYGKNEVRAYSLRNNSWRKIEDFPYGRPLPRRGEFVNGALHWIVWDESLSSSGIVSLDLGTETYGEITQPNYGGIYFQRRLIVLEGCISVFCDFFGIQADIWVMKEYGVRDSWVKLYTIPYTYYLKKFGRMEFLLASYETDEILLKLGEIMMIYNLNYSTFRSQRISNILTSPEDATIYMESLVSP